LDPWEFSIEDLEEEEVDLEEEEGVRAGAKLVSWSGRLGSNFVWSVHPLEGGTDIALVLLPFCHLF
jgi:hypothetical protein